MLLNLRNQMMVRKAILQIITERRMVVRTKLSKKIRYRVTAMMDTGASAKPYKGKLGTTPWAAGR